MANFDSLFEFNKPVIGMIHMGGSDKSDRIKRAIRELDIFYEKGVDGAIVEDYHGDSRDVVSALEAINKSNFPLKIGVNFLRSPEMAFTMGVDLEWTLCNLTV